MLTIRLTRVGKKKDGSFRVIVVESKRKVQPGNYLEMVGSYDPRVDKVELKADRIKHWLSVGATVSDTVHNLLVSNKIIDAKKINKLPAFKPQEKAVETPQHGDKDAVHEKEQAPTPEASEDKPVAEEAAAQ